MGYDVVNYMQTEAGASFVATRGEEGIESLPPNVGAHTATIVGEQDFDIVFTRCPYCHFNSTLSMWESMGNRIDEQIGQDLSVRAWVAGHHQIVLTFNT